MSSSITLDAGADYIGTRAVIVTITDDDGEPVDLTGLDVSFVVTPRLTSEPVIEKIVYDGIVIPDQAYPDTGTMEVEIDGTDTFALTCGPYRWQVQTIDDVGIQYTNVGRFYLRTNIFGGS